MGYTQLRRPLQTALPILLAPPVPTLPAVALPPPLSPSPALPAALQTHLPELQGGDEHTEALRGAIRAAGAHQHRAGQRGGGGRPHPPGAGCPGGAPCGRDVGVGIGGGHLFWPSTSERAR